MWSWTQIAGFPIENAMKSEIWRVFYSRESSGKVNKDDGWLYIWSCCRLNYKTVVENQTNRTTVTSDNINGIHSTKNDRECLRLAQPMVNFEEHRIKAKLYKKHPVKSSYQIDLVFTSILVILLCFWTTAKHVKSPWFSRVSYTLLI